MADDRLPSAALPHVVAQVTGIALGLLLTVVYAQEADPFHRLSAREIRAQIIGNVITDDAHWSQYFHPDRTLHAIVLAQRRQGGTLDLGLRGDLRCPVSSGTRCRREIEDRPERATSLKFNAVELEG